MRHWVLGGCQKLARRILKNVCCPLWSVVNFGSFLLWMVGCQCDNITKLEKKKPKKKPWWRSIEKETLLGDALIPSSTALALIGFASSSYMQRSRFQNDFLICTSCICERDFVKNDEQVLTGTQKVLICCKCSWLSVPADSGRRNAAGLDVDPFLAAHSRQSILCLIYFSSELFYLCARVCIHHL